MSNFEKSEAVILKEFENYLLVNLKFESPSIIPAGPVEEKDISDYFEENVAKLIKDKFPGIFLAETKFWETDIGPLQRKNSDEGPDYDTHSRKVFLHLGDEDEYAIGDNLNIVIDYEYTGDGH